MMELISSNYWLINLIRSLVDNSNPVSLALSYYNLALSGTSGSSFCIQLIGLYPGVPGFLLSSAQAAAQLHPNIFYEL